MAAFTDWNKNHMSLAVIQTCGAAADRNNCYFSDPTVDWRDGLKADSTSGATVFDSPVHRKIRLYVELGDDVDNTGHGTHTMGTLVGSPYDISNVEAVDYRSARLPSRIHLSSLPRGILHLVLHTCRFAARTVH